MSREPAVAHPAGASATMADALYAPVSTGFLTYDVPLGERAASYRKTIMAWPAVAEWIAAAKAEPDDIDELDVEF